MIDVKDGDVFFPLQVQLGRKLSPNTIVSLEGTKKLFHTGDLDLYDWQVALRFGLFF